MENTMRAVVQDRYGSADVLRLKEIERPTAGAEEILVRVRAAGVDRGVWHLMTGLPLILRTGVGLRTPRVPVRGMDYAGEVVAVGERVTGFQPGDLVFGSGIGSFAEYALARADKSAPMPANLSFEQAAAVPVSGCTALKALRDAGKVQPGQRVLVIGAAGGVGTYAVQLAKAYGAHVTGVCHGSKVDLVRSIGADDAIDYTDEDFASRPERYDIIIDTGGNRTLADLRRVLTPRGTLVIIGGEGGGRWFGGIDRALRAMVISPFVRHQLRPLVSAERTPDLEVLRGFIEAGQLTPAIDRTFPLPEAADAVRYLEGGHARGKIVVTV
jgi:NADPH:quinone reductase-like Zn-dependent oxidoreductase